MDTSSVTLAPIGELIAEGNQTIQTLETANDEISKEAFLQLLVAQIRHQDPLNPADGIEYLSQLAEFSSLEQMIAIREELAGLRTDVAEQHDGDAAEAEPPAGGEANDS